MLLAWMVVLVTTGYVGLASVIAVALLVPLAWWMGAEPVRLWFACIAALLVLFTHRGNLRRLRAGSESRFERIRLLRKRT
jgi:glycerol-3-phosphate acyltransferase PlsY